MEKSLYQIWRGDLINQTKKKPRRPSLARPQPYKKRLIDGAGGSQLRPTTKNGSEISEKRCENFEGKNHNIHSEKSLTSVLFNCIAFF